MHKQLPAPAQMAWEQGYQKWSVAKLVALFEAPKLSNREWYMCNIVCSQAFILWYCPNRYS